MRYFRTENCREAYELVRNLRWCSAMPVTPLRVCRLRCSIAKVEIDSSTHYSTSSVAGIIGGVSYFAAFLLLCSSTASTPSSLIGKTLTVFWMVGLMSERQIVHPSWDMQRSGMCVEHQKAFGPYTEKLMRMLEQRWLHCQNIKMTSLIIVTFLHNNFLLPQILQYYQKLRKSFRVECSGKFVWK